MLLTNGAFQRCSPLGREGTAPRQVEGPAGVAGDNLGTVAWSHQVPSLRRAEETEDRKG
jgi:hypothetical protein